MKLSMRIFLSLFVLAVVCRAQPVINVGAGCGDLPPGPPTNLKAVPGNGQVSLSWNKPANGACVSYYTVNAVPVGSAALFSQNPPQTADFSYVVQNLQNGQTYNFIVTAVSTKYASAGGNTASVQSTPQASPPPSPPNRLCLNWVRPSGPGDLRIVDKGSTYAKACWDTPTNYGCADYYTVNVQPKLPPNVLASSTFTPIKIQSGQCYTVQNLSPNTEYVMTVSSYRELYGGGGSSSIDFTTTS